MSDVERVTIRVPSWVVQDLKAEAYVDDRSLNSVMVDALQERANRARKRPLVRQALRAVLP